jgi:hypothetical protein
MLIAIEARPPAASRRPRHGTRRAQIIALHSERRLRQGREAAQRTLDVAEHRVCLQSWARRLTSVSAFPTVGRNAHKFRRPTGVRLLDMFRSATSRRFEWD